jgi:SWIM zinc finger
MFILKDKTQLERAIEKAKKLRPKVKFDHFGRYRVSGSHGGYYTVFCRKSNNGYKTVSCTCKGAERGLPCYHAAAALSLHIGLAKQRQTA